MADRIFTAAAVQMDATPAPTAERLTRAGKLVAAAAEAGARLVVLPELFSTGYDYTEANYERAEPFHGTTVDWLREQAAGHGVHLAGTLMLKDADHVYNSALLFAPDGRYWRYDKRCPFAWERAFFREGAGLTIAETELGKLGMLICWDSAHAELWQRYAGRVDAMVVMSCAPGMHRPTLAFPDGTRLQKNQLGPMAELTYRDEGYFADRDIELQAGWMNVPLIHTNGSGQFRSIMPVSKLSVGVLLAGRPDLWDRLGDSHAAWLETDFPLQTKIVGPQGQVLARVTEAGDHFTLAELCLPERSPHPEGPQPAMHTPPLAYFFCDVLASSLVTPVYRRGLRRQWGARMAPLDHSTKVWSAGALLLFLYGLLLGLLLRGRGK